MKQVREQIIENWGECFEKHRRTIRPKFEKGQKKWCPTVYQKNVKIVEKDLLTLETLRRISTPTNSIRATQLTFYLTFYMVALIVLLRQCCQLCRTCWNDAEIDGRNFTYVSSCGNVLWRIWTMLKWMPTRSNIIKNWCFIDAKIHQKSIENHPKWLPKP